MTRLPVHTTSDGLEGEALAVFDEIQKSRGMVVGGLAALLNSPQVARLVSDLGGFLRFESVLPAPVRELTILAALRANDCRFEWSFHERFAREAGVDDATIDAVKYGRDLADVPAEYREVIQGVRELMGRHELSAATRAALEARFDDKTLTELIALTGYYALMSCVLNAFEIPGPPGAPELPERPLN